MPLWALIALRWLLASALCLASVSGAVALALSFAGGRERRLARVLWPFAGLSLWSAVCLFMAAAFTGWPGLPQQVPVARLALPGFLAVLGGLVGVYWVRWAVKGARAGSAQARVAA
jgi:hypothetical protein